MTRPIEADVAIKGTGRPMVESLARAAEVRATVVAGDAPREARVSFIAADRDHDAERQDAVAGSEFVDDRIRLLD